MGRWAGRESARNERPSEEGRRRAKRLEASEEI
jgi:hypothetical protein